MAANEMGVQAVWSIGMIRRPNDEGKKEAWRICGINKRGEVWRKLGMQKVKEGEIREVISVKGDGRGDGIHRMIRWLNFWCTKPTPRVVERGFKVNKFRDKLGEWGRRNFKRGSGGIRHGFVWCK